MTIDKKAVDNILLDMRDDYKVLLLDILRVNIPQLEVWAFGSRAKWTARETSDLDLVLRNPPQPESPIDAETISGLKEIFEESDLPFMVDILDWATVSEKFRKVIEREYVVIQSPGKKGWKNSSLLSVLDEKIELNRRTNATLEAIARAIFKEWFVEFNFPVESPQPPLPKGVATELTGDFKKIVREAGGLFTAYNLDLKILKKRGLITDGSYLPYNPKLKERVRELRKNMTECEKKLWYQYLRQLPQNWLRQKPIDNYIVDFYCPAFKLVIEVDGESHFTDEGKIYDEERTAILSNYGLKVIRFPNMDVKNNFNIVCREIERNLVHPNPKSPVNCESPVNCVDPPFGKGGAKGGGLGYRDSGGEMQDSELGLIPKGWRVGKLGELGETITGKTPSSKSPEHFGFFIPFVTPTDFKSYQKLIINSERYISEEGANVLNNKILPKNSILVTCIGSDMGKVAINRVECITNQQINSIVINDEITSSEYLYQSILNKYELLKNIATGGSTLPIINKSQFENIDCLIPPIELSNKFQYLINALNEKIEISLFEIDSLCQIRDSLLPKLMNGEIEV